MFTAKITNKDEWKFCKIVDDVEVGHYDITLGDIGNLEKYFGDSLFDLIIATYKFGFYMGKRSEVNARG